MKPTHLKVVAVQMKFRTKLEDNLDSILQTIAASAADGADAILFPECAITGYNCDFTTFPPLVIQQALARIAKAAKTVRCNVLVGSPTYEGKKRLNSLVVFNRNGSRIFTYSKIQLTRRDAESFHSGNHLAFFKIDGIPCTAIICHERRYPELVRIPVMMGARIVFHPNAGLDSLTVSKSKCNGRDGIAVRAFENQVHYVFANSVGPQGDNLWSAGDSKIVSPDSKVLAMADNRSAMSIRAELDLSLAGRKYAVEAMQQPVFLREHWKQMIQACKQQLKLSR